MGKTAEDIRQEVSKSHGEAVENTTSNFGSRLRSFWHAKIRSVPQDAERRTVDGRP